MIWEETMKALGICTALALSCAVSSVARAEVSGDVVRVGVLNDISGIFRTPTAWVRWKLRRMAAEDFNGGGKKHKGRDRYADHGAR